MAEDRKASLREEFGDDKQAYALEIEKLEKECRVAKRTYEQRIQKHKIIQETCEQDIANLVQDREQKLSSVDRKEEAMEQKRRVDMQKLQEEFERAVEEYKKNKILEHTYAKQRQLREQLERENEGERHFRHEIFLLIITKELQLISIVPLLT